MTSRLCARPRCEDELLCNPKFSCIAPLFGHQILHPQCVWCKIYLVIVLCVLRNQLCVWQTIHCELAQTHCESEQTQPASSVVGSSWTPRGLQLWHRRPRWPCRGGECSVAPPAVRLNSAGTIEESGMRTVEVVDPGHLEEPHAIDITISNFVR